MGSQVGHVAHRQLRGGLLPQTETCVNANQQSSHCLLWKTANI